MSVGKSVFVLGAGASKEAGIPLVANFLSEARRLCRNPTSPLANESQCIEVFDALDILKVRDLAPNNIENLEVAYAAVEDQTLLGKAGFDTNNIVELPRKLRCLILQTIDKLTRPNWEWWDREGRRGQAVPPPPYNEFAQLLYLAAKYKSTPWELITFNYDLCLDYALHFNVIRPEYCIEQNHPATGHLLKLHGSLNWVQCKKCGGIVTIEIAELFKNRDWHPRIGTAAVNLNFLDHLSGCLCGRVHCGSPLDPDPFIVPPTQGKDFHLSAVSGLWDKALEELRKAENIFVFGYSLSPVDEKARDMFAQALVAPENLRRLWVFDPDPSGCVKPRYEEMVSNAGVEGLDFQFRRRTFRDGVGAVAELLGIAGDLARVASAAI